MGRFPGLPEGKRKTRVKIEVILFSRSNPGLPFRIALPSCWSPRSYGPIHFMTDVARKNPRVSRCEPNPDLDFSQFEKSCGPVRRYCLR